MVFGNDQPVLVSLIIPVYNEEATLAEVVARVYAVNLGNFAREVVVCDDGSSDGTSRIITELRARYPELKTYVAPINFGKGAAVRVGMSLASGDIIMVQDADLELDPADIPQVLAPFADPAVKVVYGSRYLRSSRKGARANRWANRFLTWLTNVLYGGKLTDMETAYKAFRREVLEGIRLRSVRFDFEPEVTAKILRACYRIVEVPVSYQPRTAAQGKKMAWGDGFDAIYTLFRWRFLGR
ncbi:MAG: Undecaprenyl-phosphate 4-deoxy-4-formamido-L-arabinose transferase [Chloroflexi bacterium ADurb.Bin360]|nr:MAG: Undecaprenyl-phosphate 4-deoxy-4-formamido-L-arabinose transferase [Chloroflexi bacterium ADurb.Bin360]